MKREKRRAGLSIEGRCAHLQARVQLQDLHEVLGVFGPHGGTHGGLHGGRRPEAVGDLLALREEIVPARGEGARGEREGGVRSGAQNDQDVEARRRGRG